VALENCPSGVRNKNCGGGGGDNGVRGRRRRAESRWRRASVQGLLEAVGVDYLRDGPKRPSELSGGMARRASLALQLAQHKHVIVLDEPFAGLDRATGVGVARELENIDALIEIVTHPVCFHLIKTVIFMTIIMVVAEVASRRNADLTAKDVPRVITTSVVGGSLFVIFADWVFSQLLLKRY